MPQMAPAVGHEAEVQARVQGAGEAAGGDWAEAHQVLLHTPLPSCHLERNTQRNHGTAELGTSTSTTLSPCGNRWPPHTSPEDWPALKPPRGPEGSPPGKVCSTQKQHCSCSIRTLQEAHKLQVQAKGKSPSQAGPKYRASQRTTKSCITHPLHPRRASEDRQAAPQPGSPQHTCSGH